MRVLLVNRLMGIAWGGGESFDCNIARTLTAKGEKVRVLTGQPLLAAPGKVPADLTVSYLRSPYLRDLTYKWAGKIPKVPFALLQADLRLFEHAAFRWISANRASFDVIEILALPRLARRVSQALRMPVVLRYPGPPSSRWDVPILSSLKSNPRFACFAAGDAYLQLQKHNIPAQDIPQGVDQGHFHKCATAVRQRLGIHEGSTLLLSCGRLAPGKGFEFLIDTFLDIAPRRPDLALMVVGDGILRQKLQQRVVSGGLTHRVFFTGRISHDNLPEYYSAADIFLLLSPYENFSNTVLEAMSTGLPVITTDVGGFPLQVREGVNGMRVPHGDRDRLTDAISRLADDVSLREKMGATNREETARRYTWSSCADALLGLYQRIVG